MEPSDEDNSKYLVKEFSTFLSAARIYLQRHHPTEFATYKINTKDHKKGDLKDEIIAGENTKLGDKRLSNAKKLKTWHIEGFRSLGDTFDSAIAYFYIRVKNVYFVNQDRLVGANTPITPALLQWLEQFGDPIKASDLTDNPQSWNTSFEVADAMKGALHGGIMAVNEHFKDRFILDERVIDIHSAYPSALLYNDMPIPNTMQVYEGYKEAPPGFCNIYEVDGGQYTYIEAPNHLPLFKYGKDGQTFGEPVNVPSCLGILTISHMSSIAWDLLNNSGFYNVIEKGTIVKTYQYQLGRPVDLEELKWWCNEKKTNPDPGIKGLAKLCTQRIIGNLQHTNLFSCEDAYRNIIHKRSKDYSNCVIGVWMLDIVRRQMVEAMKQCDNIIFSAVDSIGYIGRCDVPLSEELGHFSEAYHYLWNVHMAPGQSVGMLTNGKPHTRNGGEHLEVPNLTIGDLLSANIATLKYTVEEKDGDIIIKEDRKKWNSANSTLNSNKQQILNLIESNLLPRQDAANPQ